MIKLSLAIHFATKLSYRTKNIPNGKNKTILAQLKVSNPQEEERLIWTLPGHLVQDCISTIAVSSSDNPLAGALPI
jgi:hypothetical protein